MKRPHAKKPTMAKRLGFQLCEPRRLLSVSPSFAGAAPDAATRVEFVSGLRDTELQFVATPPGEGWTPLDADTGLASIDFSNSNSTSLAIGRTPYAVPTRPDDLPFGDVDAAFKTYLADFRDAVAPTAPGLRFATLDPINGETAQAAFGGLLELAAAASTRGVVVPLGDGASDAVATAVTIAGSTVGVTPAESAVWRVTPDPNAWGEAFTNGEAAYLDPTLPELGLVELSPSTPSAHETDHLGDGFVDLAEVETGFNTTDLADPSEPALSETPMPDDNAAPDFSASVSPLSRVVVPAPGAGDTAPGAGAIDLVALLLDPAVEASPVVAAASVEEPSEELARDAAIAVESWVRALPLPLEAAISTAISPSDEGPTFGVRPEAIRAEPPVAPSRPSGEVSRSAPSDEASTPGEVSGESSNEAVSARAAIRLDRVVDPYRFTAITLAALMAAPVWGPSRRPSDRRDPESTQIPR